MQVATLMTSEPTTVTADVEVERALQIMDDQDFRHLPVVEDGRLIGLVSERDVLEALGRLPGDGGSEEDVLAPNRPRTVGEIMHEDVHPLVPEDSVETAAATLAGRRIGSLPVVKEGVLVGILTEMDVLAAYPRICLEHAPVASSDPPVSERMTAKVHSVESTASLQEACSTCFSIGVRHLPVVDGGQLVGIVSDRDLRGATNSAHPFAIRVSDIMATEVETTSPQAQLAEAAERMAGLKITTLPVMEQGQLVGMLSLPDILGHCARVLGTV